MPTGVKPKATDSRDFVVIPSDQVRVAPSDAEITDLLRAAARQNSEAGIRAANDSSGALPVPAVDATETFLERFVSDLSAVDESLLVTREHGLRGAVTTPGADQEVRCYADI